MRIQLLSHLSETWNMEFVQLDKAVEEIVTGKPVMIYLSHDEHEAETPEISLVFEDGLFIRHGLGHKEIQDMFWQFRYVRFSSEEWKALFKRAEEVLRKEAA